MIIPKFKIIHILTLIIKMIMMIIIMIIMMIIMIIIIRCANGEGRVRSSVFKPLSFLAVSFLDC